MLITNTNELIENKDIKTYSCGSQRLSHEIITKLHICPINVYTHKTTGRLINVFIMSKDLSEFLTKWTKNNPKYKKGGMTNG